MIFAATSILTTPRRPRTFWGTARQIFESKHPERILEYAVSRMISRGPLQRDIMTKLHIFKGPEHKHQAQNPQILDVSAMNPKNKKTN